MTTNTHDTNTHDTHTHGTDRDDDDLTIDGVDLLAEIRARLRVPTPEPTASTDDATRSAPAPAPAPTPTPTPSPRARWEPRFAAPPKPTDRRTPPWLSPAQVTLMVLAALAGLVAGIAVGVTLVDPNDTGSSAPRIEVIDE